MMKAVSVCLRHEIVRSDALVLVKWLENPRITQYLNESRHVTEAVLQAVERVNMPILTPLFSRDGCFFMICTDSDIPIGFLRLARKTAHAEMVVVVGDQENWGHGFGKNAIRQGLDHAFLTWRTEKVVANIHPENLRSIRAFQRAGFSLEKIHGVMHQYELTLDAYLRQTLARNHQNT